MDIGESVRWDRGLPLAAVHNGIKPVWASEVEAFPIRVTKIHFPEIEHLGDITRVDGKNIPPVDIICGGSPCQDLSVAGKRKGLSGERSGLCLEQVRIVKEMRDADGTEGYQMTLDDLGIWSGKMCREHSSSAAGEDFRAFMQEIIRIADCSCDVPRPDTGRWESAGAAIWENDAAWLGECWTLNTGESPASPSNLSCGRFWRTHRPKDII